MLISSNQHGGQIDEPDGPDGTEYMTSKEKLDLYVNHYIAAYSMVLRDVIQQESKQIRQAWLKKQLDFHKALDGNPETSPRSSQYNCSDFNFSSIEDLSSAGV